MKRRTLLYTALSVIAGVVLASWWLLRENAESGKAARASRIRPPAVSSSAAPVKLPGDARGVPPLPPLHPLSAEELAEAKRRLAEFDAAGDGTTTEELRAYVDGLVTRLAFGPGMLELIQFTKGPPQLEAPGDAFWQVMHDRLQGEEGSALRHRLAGTILEISKYPENLRPLMAEWYEMAGEGCPPGDFAALAARVQDVTLRRTLQLGQNVALAATSPVEAVTSTLNYLNDGGDRGELYESLGEVLKNLPPNADHAALESLLTERDPVVSGASTIARGWLLSKWARENPAAATAYVFDHPDRMPPEVMSYMATGFAWKPPGEALAWTRTLPAGRWQDQAAMESVRRIVQSDPASAREFVDLITDPLARETTRQMVEAAGKNTN